MIKAYLKNEDAVDEAVIKMFFIVIAIAGAIAVGWYIFNTTKSQTDKQKCNGSANPFCVE